VEVFERKGEENWRFFSKKNLKQVRQALGTSSLSGQTFLEADVAQSAGKKTSCSSLSSYSSHFRSSALAMRPFLHSVA